MDIYDYLKMDHQKVAHLFKLFENSKLIIRQKEIVALITQELLAHAISEQQTFYKAIASQESNQTLIKHSDKEHKEIEEQLKKINHMAIGKNWVNEVLNLKKLVEHHVKEEEHEIFKQAKKIFNKEEALILKEQMHYVKGKFLLKYLEEIQKTTKPNKGKKLSEISLKKFKKTHASERHIPLH